MPTNINADTIVGGAIITADNSGVLNLQTGGTTAVSISTGQVVTFTNTPVISGGASVVTTTGTQTLTNKTIAFGSNTFSGTLPIANGGTNSTATPAAGGVAYGTGSAFAFTSAGTNGQVLTSSGSGAPTWAAIPPSGGSVEATASGSIAAGAEVVVNSNGTVSEVTGSFSSYTRLAEALLFNANVNAEIDIKYDAASNRFFAGMSRGATTSNPSVVVGTLSGNTITWGPTYYSPASQTGGQPQIFVKAGYVYFFYRNFGGAPFYAVYQWVSGTNELTLVTGETSITAISGAIQDVCSTYEAVNDRVIMAYRNQSNSNYGEAIMAAISGGSVTIYGPFVFNSGATAENSIAAVSSSSGYGRCVITFIDQSIASRATSVVGTILSGTSLIISSSKYTHATTSAAYTSTIRLTGDNFCSSARNTSTGAGYGIIGTVSGVFGSASITFGSRFDFSTNGNLNWLTYDAANSRIVVHFNNSSDNQINYNVATFSGTTLTWGTQQSVQTGGGSWLRSYINPLNGNVMLLYNDGSNSGYNSVTPLVPTYSTNITATNFLGFSVGSYTNGQTATVTVVGGVNNSVSGLTAGLKYYARADGTLTALEGFGVAYAGVALSATKILVKG